MTIAATGPRSDAGKQRSSRNATKHGMCSERPVVPGEDPAEWDFFRKEILVTLAPGSFMEQELADRVALQMWRLRRAARYEAEVATDEFIGAKSVMLADFGSQETNDAVAVALREQLKEVEEQTVLLAQMQSARELVRQLPNMTNSATLEPVRVATLVLMMGVTDPEQIPQPQTAGVVRRALAQWSGQSIPEALKWAAALADEKCKMIAERLATMQKRQEALYADMRHAIEARQRDTLLLPKPALERVLRYEAHVSRQLAQALKLLREFKDERLAKEEAERQSPPVAAPEEKVPVAPPAPLPTEMAAPGSFRSSEDERPVTAARTGSFRNFAANAAPSAPPSGSLNASTLPPVNGLGTITNVAASPSGGSAGL